MKLFINSEFTIFASSFCPLKRALTENFSKKSNFVEWVHEFYWMNNNKTLQKVRYQQQKRMLTAFKSYVKNLHKVSLPVVYYMSGVLSIETVDKCRQSSKNSLFSEYRMTKHLKCCNELSEHFTYRMERLIKWPLTNTKGTQLPKNISILLSWSLQYVLITLRWGFSATKHFGGVD